MKNLLILLACVFAVSAAERAQAAMVAGWDFSQYLAPSALTIDGVTGTNVLDANYSYLDPSFGAGMDAAAFGTMFINGQYGSTNVDPYGATPQFIPTDVDLISNIDAPVVPGTLFVPFNSFTVLAVEGQLFTNPLGMTARNAASVVFQADLSSVPQIGSDWGISFGAKTYAGTANVGIEFSTNGIDFTSFGNVGLTTTDTAYNVALGTAATDFAYVRLTFAQPAELGVSQAIIDNVAINASLATVPEPSAALLCGLGVGMAALSSLRRRAARA